MNLVKKGFLYAVCLIGAFGAQSAFAAFIVCEPGVNVCELRTTSTEAQPTSYRWSAVSGITLRGPNGLDVIGFNCISNRSGRIKVTLGYANRSPVTKFRNINCSALR